VGGDGDEVVKREGLVEGGERVKAVRACGADGEAEVDFAEGADARGHQGSFYEERTADSEGRSQDGDKPTSNKRFCQALITDCLKRGQK
jgi:hypothetical protein